MNKKLLLITSEFPPLPGGIGNHAYHLSLGFSNNLKEVIVVTDQRSPLLADDFEFDLSLPFNVRRIPRYKISFLTYWKRITTVFHLLFQEEEATVIASGKFSLWLAAFAKIFFSKHHFVAVLHGSEINAGGKSVQKVTKWSISCFDSLIAVSEFTKQLALHQNNSLNITVINNGFALSESIVADTDNQNSLDIVTVGNVTYRKGQQNVIKALPLLKEKFPTVHYHIVGIPTEKAAFESLANELNVTHNITFHGALPSNDLFKIVAQSKVFFMLSDHLKNGDVEGFGIAVLEANAVGLPGIGSVNSGIADAIKDGFSGKLVHPHDTEAIVAALEIIMQDYETYSNQAEIWSQQFDWSVIIQQYLAVLNK